MSPEQESSSKRQKTASFKSALKQLACEAKHSILRIENHLASNRQLVGSAEQRASALLENECSTRLAAEVIARHIPERRSQNDQRAPQFGLDGSAKDWVESYLPDAATEGFLNHVLGALNHRDSCNWEDLPEGIQILLDVSPEIGSNASLPENVAKEIQNSLGARLSLLLIWPSLLTSFKVNGERVGLVEAAALVEAGSDLGGFFAAAEQAIREGEHSDLSLKPAPVRTVFCALVDKSPAFASRIQSLDNLRKFFESPFVQAISGGDSEHFESEAKLAKKAIKYWASEGLPKQNKAKEEEDSQAEEN